MGKKSRRGRRTTTDAASAENLSADDTQKAQTMGLEHVVLTHGGAQDAAKFEEYLEVLSSHVGIQPWHQSSEVAKAMIELQAPVHIEPPKPVREYYAAQATFGIKTTDKYSNNSRTPNVPVVDDYEHAALWTEYGKDKEQ